MEASINIVEKEVFISSNKYTLISTIHKHKWKHPLKYTEFPQCFALYGNKMYLHQPIINPKKCLSNWFNANQLEGSPAKHTIKWQNKTKMLDFQGRLLVYVCWKEINVALASTWREIHALSYFYIIISYGNMFSVNH